MAIMTFQLSEEEIDNLNNMIVGISYKKKYLFYNLTVDDIIQELWIKAMEIIEKRDEVNMNIIAMGCYHKIVDMVRHNVRHYETPIDIKRFDSSEGSDKGDKKGSGRDRSASADLTFLNKSPFKSQDDEVLPYDVLSLFEDNTKEKEFVEIWLDIVGITESMEVPDGRAMDRYAAHKMGYASSSSSGYTRIKWKVRQKLAEYRMNY